MNKDILNIILYDVLDNDINSIKKTSLICKNMYNNIQLLTMKDRYKSGLNILQKYINEPNSCMREAAKSGHINIVQFMIERGAQRSIDWNMVMIYAAKGGHINIVQLLIEKSGERFNWAIGHAKYWGDTDIIELLKQHQSKKFD